MTAFANDCLCECDLDTFTQSIRQFYTYPLHSPLFELAHRQYVFPCSQHAIILTQPVLLSWSISSFLPLARETCGCFMDAQSIASLYSMAIITARVTALLYWAAELGQYHSRRHVQAYVRGSRAGHYMRTAQCCSATPSCLGRGWLSTLKVNNYGDETILRAKCARHALSRGWACPCVASASARRYKVLFVGRVGQGEELAAIAFPAAFGCSRCYQAGNHTEMAEAVKLDSALMHLRYLLA